MPQWVLSRRQAVGALLAGTSALLATASLPGRALGATSGITRLTDGTLTIEFDGSMFSRVWRGQTALSAMGAADALYVGKGKAVERFVLLDQSREQIADAHGAGTRHVLRGAADGGIERTVAVHFYERYRGLALIDTVYRNEGDKPLAVSGWRAASHDVPHHSAGAWTFSGASHSDRRDWIQPVRPGFDQRNFMGMNSSDYGGGTPVASVWRPDAGLAVGHVETVPRLLSLPVTHGRGGTRIGVEASETAVLAPGEALALPRLFVMAHAGDFFGALEAYAGIMADRGMAAPAVPESSYAPVWCAWGYERNFTTEEIYATLPKAKEVGLDWAVLDDGWQTSEGDWNVDTTKFPRGGADLKAFADTVKAAGMRPRLWYAPLAVDPGTDLLRDHPDMLLLDKDGQRQEVTWWDSYTLCPGYEPVVEFFKNQVRTIIDEWGFEGIKFDGQHLNGVAPCHNPAHKHARPEESFEKMQDFWKALYDTAMEINPEAVIEICPCGDAFAFHNIPAMNHTPASDPTSSWQVRHKGKSFKALMGRAAPYAGDHVELSDNRDDFASTYGVGGVISTKFTWPKDTSKPMGELPPGGYVLTPEKEVVWRKWIELYRKNMLSKGTYRGELYDLGFDKPEAHAIEAGGAMHYAFYADKWSGPIALRGLGKGTYSLIDPVSGRSLGTANAEANTFDAQFERALIVEAVPVAEGRA